MAFQLRQPFSALAPSDCHLRLGLRQGGRRLGQLGLEDRGRQLGLDVGLQQGLRLGVARGVAGQVDLELLLRRGVLGLGVGGAGGPVGPGRVQHPRPLAQGHREARVHEKEAVVLGRGGEEVLGGGQGPGQGQPGPHVGR
jgi:hypothetical protein